MNTNTLFKTYCVRVGHLEFRIKARNDEEAIELSRRQMAHELPRLYDVIQNLTTDRFRVEAAA